MGRPGLNIRPAKARTNDVPVWGGVRTLARDVDAKGHCATPAARGGKRANDRYPRYLCSLCHHNASTAGRLAGFSGKRISVPCSA